MMIYRQDFVAVVVLLACASCAQTPAVSVNTGIDVLQQQKFSRLRGQRVGLITNHTGVDRRGQSSILRMHESPNVELVAIFSPEHGINGVLDIAEIANSVEPVTGIPVFSLYGENRRPTAKSLIGIDTLVFDIQDVGTRFYTYISTLGLAMQAASEHKLRFVVLDRPNVINGIDVGGPVLDDGAQSFVGFHRIAVRHGMTVGELARMFQAELQPELDLDIVEMQNWNRSRYFDETGLRWVDPSPNMRSVNAAVLYPGIGLLETTNLSVGRGTNTPFELLGAPWLDGESLARELARLSLDGVRIEAAVFTPTTSKFKNEVCQGIRLTVTDKRRLDPLLLGFSIATLLASDYAGQWDIESYARLLGSRKTLTAVRAGTPAEEIIAALAPELDRFRRRRAAFLLYE